MDKNNNPNINENPDIKKVDEKEDLYKTDKKVVIEPKVEKGENLTTDKKRESYEKRVEISAASRENKKDTNLNDTKEDLYSADKTRKDYSRYKKNDMQDPHYIIDEHGKDYYPKSFYAGFWKRLIAFSIDSLIAGFLGKIIVDGVYNLASIQTEDYIYNIAVTVVMLLYFTIMTLANNGQTLGKMLMRLRVVRIDGEKLNFSTVFTREFVGRYIHTVSILKILYILTAFTERKQNLSDMFADTSVIDLSKVEAYEVGADDISRGYNKKVIVTE